MALFLTLYGVVFLFPQCGLYNFKSQNWRISCNLFSSCRYCPVPNSKCVSVLGQSKRNSSSLLNHRLIHVTFLTCQTCVHPDFTMTIHEPIRIFYLPDWGQFWFYNGQTCADSDFLLARLAPILIFYLPDWGQFWFYNGQICADSDFLLTRLAPILIFFTCKTGSNSDVLLEKKSKIAIKTPRIAKKLSK